MNYKKTYKQLQTTTTTHAKRYLAALKRRDTKTVAISAITFLLLSAGAGAAFLPITQTADSKTSSTTKTSLVNRLVNGNTAQETTKDSDKEPRTETRKETSKKELDDRRAIRTPERLRERLDRAIQDKRLSETQSKQIDNKLKEIEQFYQDVSSKPRQEQRKLIQEKQNELNEWARQSGINPSYIRI